MSQESEINCVGLDWFRVQRLIKAVQSRTVVYCRDEISANVSYRFVTLFVWSP